VSPLQPQACKTPPSWYLRPPSNARGQDGTLAAKVRCLWPRWDAHCQAEMPVAKFFKGRLVRGQEGILMFGAHCPNPTRREYPGFCCYLEMINTPDHPPFPISDHQHISSSPSNRDISSIVASHTLYSSQLFLTLSTIYPTSNKQTSALPS
jgi:hypothetical protein